MILQKILRIGRIQADIISCNDPDLGNLSEAINQRQLWYLFFVKGSTKRKALKLETRLQLLLYITQ